MLKRKKMFIMIFLSVVLTLMISINNVSALTLTNGISYPDVPLEIGTNDFVIIDCFGTTYLYVKDYDVFRVSHDDNCSGIEGYYLNRSYTLSNNNTWVYYGTVRGIGGYVLYSSCDVYSSLDLSNVFFPANYGLAPLVSNIDITLHYNDYYNSSFNYSSELISSVDSNTSLSTLINDYTTSFPEDFVNLLGFTLTNSSEDILPISSFTDSLSSDIYLWFIPRFDMNLYQSYANDKNTGQDLVYNKLTFTNFYNSLNYSDFYSVVTDLSSNSSVIYSLIDDYIEFNSYYNTSYNVKIFDKNDSLIYNDLIVVNDSHLIALSDYDSYTFSPGYQYAFISYLPNSGSIYFFNNDNVFSLGAFSLDTKSIDSTLNIPYVEDNFKITYSYDFTNYSHYILCLQREFTTDYDTFYVPKGAYVSFTSDSFDSNKNYNVPYDYKDDSGNVSSDNSQTVIISDEDKSSNSFFDNFLTYLKSFFGVFSFIGNFITDLLNAIPVAITYALCFAFGFVVLTILVKLWL